MFTFKHTFNDIDFDGKRIKPYCVLSVFAIQAHACLPLLLIDCDLAYVQMIKSLN